MSSVNPTSTAASQPLQVVVHPQSSFWGSDAPNFQDFLDVINPLQHIPLVSNLYQSLTGDTPSTGSKLAGGALFGGPIGFIASIVDSIVQGESGKDIGGNLLAAINGDSPKSTQTADNSTVSGAPSTTNTAAYAAYIQTHNLLG